MTEDDAQKRFEAAVAAGVAEGLRQHESGKAQAAERQENASRAAGCVGCLSATAIIVLGVTLYLATHETAFFWLSIPGGLVAAIVALVWVTRRLGV